MPADTENLGVRCPRCGCAHMRASYKKDILGGERRVKICRHCGTRVQTKEEIERILPPTKKQVERSEVGGQGPEINH